MAHQIIFTGLGADPEVFLKDKSGVPFSAEGLFGGTKAEPKPMDKLPQGFYIQEDNVAAEFNIPVAYSPPEFAQSIFRGVKYIAAKAKHHKLEPCFESALHFPPKQLMTEHAQLLGCEPDFNAWTRDMNPRPRPPQTLRTAAGHIHIGWKNATEEDQINITKLFDVFLVIPSLLATEPNERRSLYGKAGSYRPKKYGVECRALDNFWLKSKQQCEHIYTQVATICSLLNNEGEYLMDEVNDTEEEIRSCINNHHKGVAMELMDRFSAYPFPSV